MSVAFNFSIAQAIGQIHYLHDQQQFISRWDLHVKEALGWSIKRTKTSIHVN